MRWWDFFVAAGMGKWEVWSGGVWYVFWSLGGCGFGVASADGMDGWSSCLEMENGEIYISIPAQTHSLSLSLSSPSDPNSQNNSPQEKKKESYAIFFLPVIICSFLLNSSRLLSIARSKLD